MWPAVNLDFHFVPYEVTLPHLQIGESLFSIIWKRGQGPGKNLTLTVLSTTRNTGAETRGLIYVCWASTN